MNKLIVGTLTTGFVLIFAGILTLVVIDGTPPVASVHAEVMLPATEPDIVMQRHQDSVQRADLAFSSTGTVVDLLVSAGDHVVAGQVLARLDTQQQIAEVAKARADLVRANAMLVEVRRAKQIEANLDALESPQAELASALRELVIVVIDFDEQMAQAVTQRDQAVDQYRNVFDKYLGLDLTEEQLGMDPQQVLQQVGIDLEMLFDPILRPVPYGMVVFSVPGMGIQQAPMDDPATVWNEALVYAWLHYYTGGIFISFEEIAGRDPWEVMARDEESINIGMDMIDAWEPLRAAWARIDAIGVEQSAVVAFANNRVGEARETLANVSKVSAELESDALVLALADVEVAKANLTLAEIALGNMSVQAPFDGTISTVNQLVTPGGWVAQGAVLLRLIS